MTSVLVNGESLGPISAVVGRSMHGERRLLSVAPI